MASTLISKLNANADKSPDEIARLLRNPWKLMSQMTRGWYEANAHREVYLYATSRGSVGYAYLGNRYDRLEQSRPQRVDNWSFRTWEYDRTDTPTWFWAFADEAVPFQVGVHDVCAT
jgi:hypothetical protein